MLASRRNGTIYVGVTSDLIRRIHEHRIDTVDGFTRRHHIHTLVRFERHDSMLAAIIREKSIREWRRAWKLRLIETTNPRWRDLFPDIIA